jgi:hypothetical protein
MDLGSLGWVKVRRRVSGVRSAAGEALESLGGSGWAEDFAEFFRVPIGVLALDGFPVTFLVVCQLERGFALGVSGE